MMNQTEGIILSRVKTFDRRYGRNRKREKTDHTKKRMLGTEITILTILTSICAILFLGIVLIMLFFFSRKTREDIEYILENTNQQFQGKIQFIEDGAVAEPDEERRNWFVRMHDLPENAVFAGWEELFEQGKLADCCMVCTQDRSHTEPVKRALALGYHVMCEKPMSPDAKECLEMREYAKKYNRTLTICHVLRYSPFFTQKGRSREMC